MKKDRLQIKSHSNVVDATKTLKLDDLQKRHTHRVLPFGKVLLLFSLCLLFLCSNTSSFAQCLAGNLGGTVFNDISDNGFFDTGELGLAGITVNAYQTGSTSPDGTAITSSTGVWTITTALTYPVRVEFVLPTTMPWLQPSVHGSSNATAVQFVSTASCAINFGVLNPEDYCQSSPDIAFSCFTSGALSSNVEPSVGRIPYTATTTSQIDADVSGSVHGALYGVAYDRDEEFMYSAAFLKRHVGISSSGLGAIYKTRYDFSSPITVLFTTISNVGTIDRTGTNALPASMTSPSVDADAFAKIGKVGLGDIDVSADGNTLYTVNLNTRNLVQISDVKGTPTSSEITITSAPTCTNGVFRPLGVKVYQNKVYVGGVCTGENGGSGADLTASIHEYNPTSTSWSSILSFDLTSSGAQSYNHGDVVSSFPQQCTEWEPWADVYTERNLVANTGAGEPFTIDTDGNFELVGGGSTGVEFRCRAQAMISDIEFTTDGYMLISLMDRTGHQFGYQQHPPTGAGTGFNNGPVSSNNGGDMLMAFNNNGTWELESNGSVGTRTSSGASNTQGPGGGEFFFENSRAGHEDADAGGIAFVSSEEALLGAVLDPNGVFGGGIAYYDVTDGTDIRDFAVAAPGLTPGIGKANGIGDLEAFCDPAFFEIGNYIWNDADADGIQDPNETPIVGVTVELYKDGLLVGSTTTDGNGNYYFNNSNVNLNGATGLLNDMTYTIRVPNAEGGSQQGVLTGLALTFNDTDTDNRDSDVTLDNNNGEVTITTSPSGRVDHTFDIGFTDPTLLPVELITFNGKAINEGILLEWKTASEENNSGFDVERSENGKTFKKVALVKGNGTTVSTQTYQFLDEQAIEGENYYRLKQIDFDDTFEYSHVVIVNHKLNDKQKAITVYPNPAKGSFQLELPIANARIQLYNMQGKLVKDLIADSTNYTVNTADLAKGIYLLKAQVDHQSTILKVVLE